MQSHPYARCCQKLGLFNGVTNTIKSLLIYTKIGKKKIMDGSLVPRPHPAFCRLQSFFVRTWGEPGNEAGMSPWVTCSCSVPTRLRLSTGKKVLLISEIFADVGSSSPICRDQPRSHWKDNKRPKSLIHSSHTLICLPLNNESSSSTAFFTDSFSANST